MCLLYYCLCMIIIFSLTFFLFIFPHLYQLGANATLWSTPSGTRMQTSPTHTDSSYVSNFCVIFLLFPHPGPRLCSQSCFRGGCENCTVQSLHVVLKRDCCWHNPLLDGRFSQFLPEEHIHAGSGGGGGYRGFTAVIKERQECWRFPHKSLIPGNV